MFLHFVTIILIQMLRAVAFKCVHKNKEYPSSLCKSTHKEGVIMHIEMLVLCSKNVSQEEL